MKNFYHPWKLSIAQTIFYSEKKFLIKMFSRLWWKGLFVEPKMVQIKIPEVSLFLQQKQRNLWNLNISDYRLTDYPRVVWEIISEWDPLWESRMTRICSFCSPKALYLRWIEVGLLFGGGQQILVGKLCSNIRPDTDKLPNGSYLMHCATQRKPVAETVVRVVFHMLSEAHGYN